MDEHRSLLGEREGGRDAALSELVNNFIGQGMSPDQVTAKIEELVPGVLPKLGATLLSGLELQAPEMLEDRAARRARFSRRLQKKWGHPFTLLRMLIEAARESGEEYFTEHGSNAAQENDIVFEALVRLHARSCLVAEEVFCLIEGGLASGAHARWRTLHELTTVLFFIQEQGPEVAERYLLHHVIESCSAAEQYQEHCHVLRQEPFTQDELREFREGRDELCRRFGTGYERDWGWAADALSNQRPRFSDIEQAVNLSHLRPYFKMACHPTHAGSKGLWNDLGNALNPDGHVGALAGPSDAGLSEPGICTALSILQATTALMLHREPTLAPLTVLEALKQLSHAVQGAFAEVNARLEDQAPKVRARLQRFEAYRLRKSDAS